MTSRGFRRAAIAAAVVSLVVALVPTAAMGAPQSGSDVGSGGAAGGKVSRWASGVDTEAALGGPNCDPATGRLAFGSRYRPPCVRSWPAGKSAGATAPGVSAAAIKVAILVPNDRQIAALTVPGGGFPGGALPVNQATRQVGTFADAARDASAVFDKAGFETWGRTFEFVYVVSTGNDEAAQLADAASVIAQQPFAVIVPLPTLTIGVGGPVFEREVASRKIVVVGYPSTKEALAQEPYRWSTALGDDWAQMYLTAEFVGKQLAGRAATHAGSPGLRASERVFGVLYPSGATGLDIRRFRRALDKFAGEPTRAVVIDFDPAMAAASPVQFYQEVLPGFVAQLRAQGVTTMIPFADSAAINALMKAATNLGFEPEWISTGTGASNSAFSTRSWDQDQASRFFGLQGGTVPVITPAATQPLQGFQWYWGVNAGTAMGSVVASLELLRTGVHLAGPRLTPSTFATGICAMGAVGGAADGTQSSMRAPCRTAGLPWDVHHSAALDVALGWWDPTATYVTALGVTVGPGAWRFVDNGRRRMSGTFPRVESSFFEPARGVTTFDTPRESDTPPSYPCVDCPGGLNATLTADVTPVPRTESQLSAAVASGAALPEDFADPFVLNDAGAYYAYSTGGPRGAVQVARSTDLKHWSWLGAALATVPQWATGRSIWAPSVIRLGDRYVMYFAARDRATGLWCLSYAVAPHPNAVFVDTSTSSFLCQADRGGSIDPHAFLDRDGTPYLLWKAQSPGGAMPSLLLGAQLVADGTAIVPATMRTLLATANAWEGDIIENPAMTIGSDGYSLLYSGNTFESDKYATGLARCAGPLGPCTRVADRAVLASSAAVLGPGGAVPVVGPDGLRYVVFHAWASPRVGYRAGGARSLYVLPLSSLGLAAS